MKKLGYLFITLLFISSLCLMSCNKKTECEKNGHNWQPATCEKSGHCTKCNELGEDALGHNFLNATCTTPKTCSLCGKTEGSALGHNFLNATCTNPKTCSICGTTEGTHLEHNWLDATCKVLKTCSLCGKTEGSLAEHKWVNATTEAPKTCSVCGLTEGNPLPSYIPLNATINDEYISVGSYTNINITDYFDLESFNLEFDSSIVEIDLFGRVTGLKIGTTEIKITNIYDEYNYSILSIEVISPMPNAYTNLHKMTLSDVNNIYIQNIDELLENDLSDFYIEFTNNILSLNANNQLIAKDLGIEIVKITSKKDTRVNTQLTIEVVDDTTNVVLSSSNEEGIIKVGEQLKLSMNNFTSENFVWTTTDGNIAVVTDRGYVTAKKEGIVTIRVYDKNDKNNENKKCSYTLTISGTGDIDYVSNLIHTALREYGTKEGPDNDQKYGEWYGFNYNAWCAMFVSWSLYHSGQNSDLFIKYMNCRVGLRYAAENNMARFMQPYSFDEPLDNGRQHFGKDVYTPKPGDIIMLFDVGHTGIVIYADETYVYTVEGNSSNMVAVRRYELTSTKISAYISLNYPQCENPEDFSWIKEPKSDGYYWWDNCGDPDQIV